jgi:hypothetical protein
MAHIPTCVGIDLGTTTCRAALAGPSGAAPVANRFASRRLAVAVTLPPPAGADTTDGPLEAGLHFEGLKQKIGVTDRVAGLHGPAPLIDELADVLGQVREDILASHDGEIAGAVATVTGFWPERARVVMREAMWRAGWPAVRLLDEALAAVLGDAAGQPEPGTVLVCALGAGMFCATVVRVDGHTPRMLSVEGDRGLGGFAFDAALIQLILEKLYPTGRTPLHEDSAMRLQALAEQVKVGLSRRDEVEFDPGPAVPAGTGAGATLTIPRAEFETAIESLMVRMIGLAMQAVEHAGIGPDAISRGLLVGEASAMPIVERSLASQFSCEWRRAGDGAAALGAALFGQRLSRGDWRVQDAPGEPRRPDLQPVNAPQPAARASDSWVDVFSGPIVEAQGLWKTDRSAAILRFEQGLTLAREFLGTLIKNGAEDLLAAGHHAEAVMWLREARAQSPGDDHIRRQYHVALGRYARDLHGAAEFFKAREVIQKSLEIDPRCPECRQVAAAIDAAIRRGRPGRGGPRDPRRGRR